MIEIATLFLGIVLAQIAPGPNMMAVASAALGTSRVSGVATAAGVATGVLGWATLFALGIGAILETFPQAIIAMRFIGGGYLLFLGCKTLRSLFISPHNDHVTSASAIAAGAAYRRGLLVVMTNPKAAMMWIAITMFLASSKLSAMKFLMIGAGASASAMMVYGTYAVLFSTGVAIRTYKRFFRAIDGAFGIVFGAVGVKLVADGIRALRS